MPRKKLQTKEEVLSALRAMEARGLSYAAYSSIYIDPQFLEDRNFLREAVKINGNLLNKVEEPLKYDREILLIAAKNDNKAQNPAMTKEPLEMIYKIRDMAY